ncbi:ribosome recycling factor [Patescibacteria group bacterium]|nr:ribosome recycling factor [Patescibacteria group bacterium]
MLEEILARTKQEMEKAAEHLSYELSKIRTGQASPSLVEDVPVELFGSRMTVKQVAGISCPERNQILVQPWDRSYLEPIEKALQQVSVGASPVVDKDTIRLTLPALTEEFREKLRRVVSTKAEEARESMRRARDEAWSELQEGTRKGELREDDKFRGKDELQKLIDGFHKRVEEMVERKNNELHG